MFSALLPLAALLASAEGGGDRPEVAVLESVGRIDGPSTSSPPIWDRVRVDLKVENRLPVEIDDLSVEITLVVRDGEGEDEPIPGWKVEQTFTGVTLPANEQTPLSVDRSLPARRSTQPADQIAYRVEVTGYRLVPPSLELATHLLESAATSDQRAALWSYQRLREPGAGPGAAEVVLSELAKALAAPPREAEPTAALRLLFALYAAGEVDHPPLVPLLLALPQRLDAPRWSAALAELTARMVEASLPSEPRLELLPGWARSEPLNGDLRGSEILVGAVQQTLLKLGEHIVPELVRAAGLGESQTVRVQARTALQALGRGTVRSQLTISDRETRSRLLEVYGELRSADSVPALVDVLSRRSSHEGPELDTLKKIGGAAVQPLVDGLSTPDRGTQQTIVRVLESLGTIARRDLTSAASRFGLVVGPREGVGEIARRLSERLAANARTRWIGELTRALGLAKSGDHDEAFRILDAVYAADPELYLRQADAIAYAYLDRAKSLLARGNYDAAIEIVRVGLTIKRLPEMLAVLRNAQLTLARGYLALDELDRADEALGSTELIGEDPEMRSLSAQIILRRANLALSRGEYGRARALLDRARAIEPEAESTQELNRRLRVLENVPIVLVLSLLVPGGALSLVLVWRRKVLLKRMQRLIER